MSCRLLVPLLLLCMFMPCMTAYGITSDFRIRTFIGDDTNPPSVPTNLTATPIAISQINLAWDPSTDDFELSGYHVWRDGVQIATTTTTTYADIGLMASTTYAYYVTAYDHIANESASSTVVATTTLSIPIPPADTGSRYGTRLPSMDEVLISLQVVPQKDSVTITYATNMYVRSVLKWGRTSSYELGSLAEQAFAKKHENQIVGLIPGTTYYFTILGEDRFGRTGVLYTGTFTTLPPEDTFPPGNVTGLTAVRDGDDVLLSWQLPYDPDLAYVRVVRNDRFYPTDEADGWVVYEGKGEGTRDVDAVVGAQQFYTVFSYDALGNMSSGAVVVIRFGTPVHATTSTSTLPGEIVPTQNPIALTFADIAFIQEGELLPSKYGTVQIDGTKQLTIAIPYDKVPEHLKTILVTVRESADSPKSFDFLLRINPEQTAYVSTLAPFGFSGELPITVSVFDFTTAQIGYAEGRIISHIQPSLHVESKPAQSFLAYLLVIIRSYFVWFIILLLLLMLIGWRLVRREE